jgi:zinc protease
VQAPAGLKDQLPDSKMLLADLVAASKRPVKPYIEKAVATTLLTGELVPGKTNSETKNEKLGTTNIVLSNGVVVCIKPTTFKNDEIQMDAWRWGGSHKYTLANKENAALAGFIVQKMGVSDMSVTDLQKFMAGKSVSVQPYLNTDEEGIQGQSSVKDFETFLQLVHLYFTKPRRDESAFNSFINNQKSFLQFLGKDPVASYEDTLQKIIYDNNPWAGGANKAEDYDKINLDTVMAIYHSVFGNAYGMHFTFVGNIDPDKAKPLLERYIGSLPSSPKENKYTDVGLRPIKGITDVAIKRGKEPKASIRLFFEGETTYNRDNRLQLAALVEVLNIKITEKLREDLGGIYTGGFNGGVYQRPYEHYIVQATVPCGPENVEKLTAALLGIVKTIQEKGIDPKDLTKVKETWKKQYHTNLQRNNYWLYNLSIAFINQDNPENILDYEQKINSITVQNIQDVARKYLTLDNMVKSILYPENYPVKEEVKTVKKGF